MSKQNIQACPICHKRKASRLKKGRWMCKSCGHVYQAYLSTEVKRA